MKYCVKSFAWILPIFGSISFAQAEFGDTLTKDWGGSRSELKKSGFHFDLEYTNVMQSALSSSYDTNPSISHRLDLISTLDLESIGLLQGGKIHSQLVTRGGNANDFGFTALSAPNSGQYGADDTLFISSLYYSQQFSSNTNVLLGKIDAFELLRNAPFFGGATRHGFLNLAFAAPPSGVTPPSFVGVIANHNHNNLRFTGMIYDPRDRYTSNLDMNGLFQDGVNMSLSMTYGTQWFERSTAFTMAYTYSTEKGLDFSSLDPNEGSFIETAQYKYNARFQLSHNLVESEDNAGGSWGIYLRGAIADGNPNLIDATFVGGLGGSALFFDRPMDTWGIGYYYYDLSNDLQDSINGLPLEHKLQDESGFEIYYAYKALPWLTFTADMQYVVPALSTDAATWLAGLRTNITF